MRKNWANFVIRTLSNFSNDFSRRPYSSQKQPENWIHWDKQLLLRFNIRIRIYPDNPVIRWKLFVSGYFSCEYPNNIRIYPSNSYFSICYPDNCKSEFSLNPRAKRSHVEFPPLFLILCVCLSARSVPLSFLLLRQSGLLILQQKTGDPLRIDGKN